MNTRLISLVCGYERDGTTVVSEILRQHPELGSGFEGGFLLCSEPREFISLEPYARSLQISWGVSDESLKYICDTSDWAEVYARLLETSTKVDSRLIYDKTPRYMECLADVLGRIENVPVIVIVRDPRSVLYSWAKRSNAPVEHWVENNLKHAILRYRKYARGFRSALESEHKDRVLRIQYEELCTDPIREAGKIFHFIGMTFDKSYLSFPNPQKSIHKKKIAEEYIYEYKPFINEKACQTIRAGLSDSVDWFWE